MNEQIIATKIKEIRTSMKMTQNKFGEFINVAQTTLSSYEKGIKTPNIDTLYNIAKRCDVSIDWLCGLSDIKSNSSTAFLSPVCDTIKTLILLTERTDTFLHTTTINRFYDNSPSSYNPGYDIDYTGLFFEDQRINDFIVEWQKMKELYDQKTIDKDLYDLWIEKTINNIDVKEVFG